MLRDCFIEAGIEFHISGTTCMIKLKEADETRWLNILLQILTHQLSEPTEFILFLWIYLRHNQRTL